MTPEVMSGSRRRPVARPAVRFAVFGWSVRYAPAFHRESDSFGGLRKFPQSPAAIAEILGIEAEFNVRNERRQQDLPLLARQARDDRASIHHACLRQCLRRHSDGRVAQSPPAASQSPTMRRISLVLSVEACSTCTP